jgi:hypothetical protein
MDMQCHIVTYSHSLVVVFRNGGSPQPLHQSDAYGYFINLLWSFIVLITAQGSTNVATNISQ